MTDPTTGAVTAANGGKVYIIYGSSALAALVQASTATNKVINLDDGTLAKDNVKEIILEDSNSGITPGSSGNEFGYSVSGLGNYFNYGSTAVKDIAIGAPGEGGGAGAAFALSGLALEGVASGTVVDLTNITTTNKLGIKYSSGGTGTGSSVAPGLDFDHATTAGSSPSEIDDLLIGVPGANEAYLVYGDQQKANTNGITDSMIGTVQDLTLIPTTPPANTTINYPLEGLLFQGSKLTPGSTSFGFSVSTAGDFNGDGTDDIIVGAPDIDSAAVIYGVPEFVPPPTNVPLNVTTHLTGAYTPDQATGDIPQVPPPLVFQGQSTSTITTASEAGYSVSYIGDIPGQGINGVLIGAPLARNGTGEVDVIPGNYETPTVAGTANFPSNVPLSTATSSPVYAGFALFTTQSFVGTGATNLPYLGTSVSGRSPLIPVSGSFSQQFSIDQDNIPDVIAGAPGFNLATPGNSALVARPQAGIAYLLEGSDLPNTPPNNVILSPAGIGTNSPTGPYNISPTAALTIYLFSQTTGTNGSPALDPLTDIATPATLKINGVTFTNVTLTPSPSATDPDEVKFTLTTAQVKLLNLVSSTTPISFSIQGTTVGGTVFIARAQSDVTVSGGGAGGGGGGGAALAGPPAATILAPPIFTGDLAGLPYPAVSTLSHLVSYQPISVQLAYEQYLPAAGFLAREEVSNRPSKKSGAHQAPAGTALNVGPIGHSENKYLKYNSLLQHVFDRGKFKVGRKTTFTHKQRVIPAAEQTESFPG